MGLVIVILLMVGTLAAQPDPVVTCRLRASALTHTVIANTSAERRGGLANGNVMVLWKAKLSNGHIVSGSCEASPQTAGLSGSGPTRIPETSNERTESPRVRRNGFASERRARDSAPAMYSLTQYF